MERAGEQRLRYGYLVERYEPGITIQHAVSTSDRVAAATAEIANDGVDIRYLGTLLLPDDEAMLDMFCVASPQPVQVANQNAGTRVARLTHVVLIAPNDG